jgi:CRISPR-associated endoribonuclease Cas6
VDPDLATTLHNANTRKSFTLSPIQGLPSPSQGLITLREGWMCWLRVTILNDVLFRTFIEYFLYGTARPSLRLGDAHFTVSEILTTPGSHPWAGYTTLEELQKRLDEPPPPSIAFHLHSPTSFKTQNDQFELIPYPKFVFGNLANAWKTLSGEDQVKAIEQYALSHLRLVLHRIERKALVLHNRPQLGVVGQVEYHFLDRIDTPLARALNLLADLAFFTGLGRKTTQGMGQCRRINPS